MSGSTFDSPESRSQEPFDPDAHGSQSVAVSVRRRTLAVAAGALAIVTAVAIFGFGSLAGADERSGSGTSGSSAASPHSLPQLTADQKTCLKNALGDLIPAPGSTPAMPTQDQIKNGISKLEDAMTKCGVTLPAGGVLGSAGLSGLTADQKTCLKNALGDLIPAPGSTPAMPTQDQIKNGISKLEDAMTKCGVTLPAGGSAKI